MKLHKFVSVCLLSLLLSGSIGNFIPRIKGTSPSTVKYAVIMENDSEWKVFHTPDIFLWSLQPVDFYNVSDVTYDDLFSAPNTPKYSMIYLQRGAPTATWKQISDWVLWSHRNGSSVFMHYDVWYTCSDYRDEWFGSQNGASACFPEGTWVNISSYFVDDANFQLKRSTSLTYYTVSDLPADLGILACLNTTDQVVAVYRNETATKGRFVFWGDYQSINYPISYKGGVFVEGGNSYYIGDAKQYIASLYWCANAPVVHAIDTRTNRGDDHWAATPSWEDRNATIYQNWLLYAKSYGFPFTNVQVVRRHNCTVNTHNEVQAGHDSNYLFANETSSGEFPATGRPVSEPPDHPAWWAYWTLYDWNEGWVEMDTHGWTHWGNCSAWDSSGNKISSDTVNEFDDMYDYDGGRGDNDHNILDHLNMSVQETCYFAQNYRGFNLQPSDIKCFTICGTSKWGNKSAVACDALGIDYIVVYGTQHGYLYPNGTFANWGATYVDLEGQVDAFTIGGAKIGTNYDEVMFWDSGIRDFYYCSDAYQHPASLNWTSPSGDPNRHDSDAFGYLEARGDSMGRKSWSRTLFQRDLGSYLKGYHDETDWISYSMTWDGTTIGITDSAPMDYIVKLPFGMYVLSVIMNGQGWYVFSDTEVYVPASATSVSITTSNSKVEIPHVQTVRRANINVTASSYANKKLSVTVNGIKNLYSEIEVYCGSVGEPTTVSGATSWSYDTSTNILTMAAIHTGTTTITISWGTEPVTATVDISMDTLSLKSKGKWITAHIELPEGYDVSDIDISTVRLNGEIQAESHPTKIGDYDADGVPDLMVKFDRQDAIALLCVGEATLTITGKFDETPFEGTDTIRVTNNKHTK